MCFFGCGIAHKWSFYTFRIICVKTRRFLYVVLHIHMRPHILLQFQNQVPNAPVSPNFLIFIHFRAIFAIRQVVRGNNVPRSSWFSFWRRWIFWTVPVSTIVANNVADNPHDSCNVGGLVEGWVQLRNLYSQTQRLPNGKDFMVELWHDRRMLGGRRLLEIHSATTH